MNNTGGQANQPSETNWPPTRRRLLEFLLGSGLAASVVSILYPIFQYLLPPETAELDTDTVVAARLNELAPGTAKIFRFGNRPGLLIRLPEGGYRALTAVCTHLNCTVQYRTREQNIWCACHNGIYDLQGRNVSGPPPRPLEEFEVHERGEEIVVARRQRA